MFVFNLFHSVLVLLEQADIISNKSKSAIFINDSLGFQKGGGGTMSSGIQGEKSYSSLVSSPEWI